ncbi:type I-E CRISPR-associated protein Cse2/CasB [Nocardiopsis eucommiae]|uniref:Type I-E CRISPR-associated protein Cse2/CasB n=1 Tax=Nocardiopsis eucommiae TaxID=2831970 RepID=A0A975L7H0_9ACTN|nr:type I-E CRISPR-associated protein Cse2/CasB [Nocardiopsis eucommiae]
MISQSKLMSIQRWEQDGRIWQEWREGIPGPATCRAVVPVVDATEGPEWDAVWMVAALQAGLPRRASLRGTVTIGQAGASSMNAARLRKAIVAARNGDRDRLLRYLVDIAKAHHNQMAYRPLQLNLSRWARETADALSGDPAKVGAVCQRWLMDYTKQVQKLAEGSEEVGQEETVDAHV